MVDLSQFDNSDYDPGRSFLIRAIWFVVGLPLLRCSLLSSSALRSSLLRLFGADIGDGAVIKPGVRIKYPWKFHAGNHCWLGEDSWFDNLALVQLGDHVCISQGVYFCTGNHDWRDKAFHLTAKPIRIDDGAWIAARASIGPGVVVGESAVIAFGAVVTRSIPRYEIHGGNPAVFLSSRYTSDAGEYVSTAVGARAS